MFISFEGIDGSGKTTQAHLLYNHLQHKGKYVITTEPTQGEIGKFVRKEITKRTINPMAIQLLFVADRSSHIEDFIKPKLDQGYTVITDRYLFSTIAYGAASGLDEEWLKAINSRFIKPDITFIFDIDPKIAMQRIESRAAKTATFENLKFLQTTREVYKRLAKEKGCYVIDASKGVETIKDEILSIVEKQ